MSKDVAGPAPGMDLPGSDRELVAELCPVLLPALRFDDRGDLVGAADLFLLRRAWAACADVLPPGIHDACVRWLEADSDDDSDCSATTAFVFRRPRSKP